jgi:hypothetical protein
MSQASLEMERFTQTRAYEWLDNLVSQSIAMSQRQLAAPEPENVTHGKFIAESARCRAYELFHKGTTYLVNWKGNDDGNETSQG